MHQTLKLMSYVMFPNFFSFFHSDDSLHSTFPFTLRCTQACGLLCGNQCSWYRFCYGCHIPCNDQLWQQSSKYIAIDWDPTALHLRYQPSVEKVSKCAPCSVSVWISSLPGLHCLHTLIFSLKRGAWVGYSTRIICPGSYSFLYSYFFLFLRRNQCWINH